jgi:hypothetical protein
MAWFPIVIVNEQFHSVFVDKNQQHRMDSIFGIQPAMRACS